ncbi:MAG: cell division protein FtsL [Aquificae bacterium]|nr:cell division protein FtsL [Aquificota bacterium]
MVRETVYELKRDLSQIRKYIKYGLFFLVMGGTLVLYNQYYFKVEREIMNLSQLKGQLSARNLMLKKEVSRLSSPERIEKIARKRLKMKPVDYSKVRFIETK